MNATVELPLWLVILVVVLSAIAALDRILVPSVRWFFRRRMEQAVARLNARLERPIAPFKLARRHDMILRLAYDPKVMQAVAEQAAEAGIPPNVAAEQARDYAAEIVPAFSATMYFGFAVQLARWITRAFYEVRIGSVSETLDRIDRDATVVFVMNHRSNMDYVLVTWLIADRQAISYAVGEWARVWPLSRLIRGMGAYFIRRGSRNTLYRRVLARYVQMAASEGVAQAIFPEGGLSLDGKVGAARLGLLSYFVAGFDPAGRDVLFVPVGLAYDRVLEDRVLVEAADTGQRRFRPTVVGAAAFSARMLWRMLRGNFPGFGATAAGFGAPVSLRAFMAESGAGAGGDAGGDPVAALGAEMMARIVRSVPVLPVPLVAAALGAGDAGALAARVADLVRRLEADGASLRLHPGGLDETLRRALRHLQRRGMIGPDLQVRAGKEGLVAFYAAPVLQRLERADAATRQT
ncbi:1-acyl-sn-glycerol-3-phosphate acyltransferase [Paragemmobacter straminiformis]|uniref:Glycerol-3-phosphate acyltransferase n=1 Tax=Paragemmobacter straminiformis TaxID=2045119 RepID=A0A842I1L7_9RHOB|nr:1-acyl-sn-glycerol-3-phosphate acyltransferase [Gemmobacter straminiformis]MBC2834272.1 1-acyl-sn-glycerol-3-phosphate acyltransferase [Gemmobacter straminiformis]